MNHLFLIFIVTYIVKLLVIPSINLQLRPLVLGVVMGFLLGDIQNGVVFGAFLEIIYLGLFGVGGAPPLDADFAGIIGVGVALATGKELYVAFVVGLLASVIGLQAYTRLIKPFNLYNVRKQEKALAAGNIKEFEHLHLLGILIVALIYALFAPLVYAIGINFIEPVLDNLPTAYNMFLQVFCLLFPLVSLVGILQHELTKLSLPFLILGFGLAAYLGANSAAVLVLAGVLCYVIYYLIPEKQVTEIPTASETKGDIDDEEDFF